LRRCFRRDRGTTATAATIVSTPKNIKNGTIQTVDISVKAKRALRPRLSGVEQRPPPTH
jgi:hypothetical protein